MNKLILAIALLAGLALSAEACADPEMVRIPGKDYEIGKYEVTQKEWRDIMGSNPSKFTDCGDNCPVEQVSWDDIQTFLQKLNQNTGRQYRLPTEAEWEYACYGGSQTEYCGGGNLDAVGWYWGNSNQTTHPIGQKQANGYGLYDMSGNVFEWVQDWYGSSQEWRVHRGGSWYGNPQIARAANRDYNNPARRSYGYGFRLARTLTPDDNKPAQPVVSTTPRNPKLTEPTAKPATTMTSSSGDKAASTASGLVLKQETKKPEVPNPAPVKSAKPAETKTIKLPEETKPQRMETIVRESKWSASLKSEEAACKSANEQADQGTQNIPSMQTTKRVLTRSACSCKPVTATLPPHEVYAYNCFVSARVEVTQPAYKDGPSSGAQR
jgi:hypothetical protein